MRLDNTPINEYDKYRVVGEVSHIPCNICKKIYKPDNSDISLNGNFYYKNCKEFSILYLF